MVSLSLVFSERPNYFSTEERKISYTLSFLSGSAKEWFEPDLIDPDPIDPPAWMFNYAALVDELVDNFSAYDLEGDAEDSLGELQMQDSDQVHKYIIQFNSLAANVNWDD